MKFDWAVAAVVAAAVPCAVASDAWAVDSGIVTPTQPDYSSQPNLPGALSITNDGALRVAPVTGSFTNKSGTITTGGTAKTVAIANTARKGIVACNPPSAAESLFGRYDAAATLDKFSIELVAGQCMIDEGPGVSTQALSLNASTTGHPYTVWEK